MNLHQTGSVGEGHLQLIKFWLSYAPRKGSAVGQKIWLCLTTARAQCLRLSEHFFILKCFYYKQMDAELEYVAHEVNYVVQ